MLNNATEVFETTLGYGGAAPYLFSQNQEQIPIKENIEICSTNLPRFKIISADEFASDRGNSWMIKNVIPRAGLAVVYGESGSGKSFVVLDMLFSIARRVPWRGHRVTAGRAIYVCAEGLGGARKRVAAYSRHNDICLKSLPLGIIMEGPNLLEHDDKEIAQLSLRIFDVSFS